jgi:hypothetical protein
MANVDQMLAIASQKASDGIRRATGCPGQAGWTATHFLSEERHKQTRTDHLHRQDASTRWRCPYYLQRTGKIWQASFGILAVKQMMQLGPCRFIGKRGTSG